MSDAAGPMCEAHSLISPMKRKKRRVAAAVLAALMAASFLAAVGGTPANAANTSGEELIDTDNDGIGDTREFAGSHRYNTAVALAQRFAEDEDNLSTVIIASETFWATRTGRPHFCASATVSGSILAPDLLP